MNYVPTNPANDERLPKHLRTFFMRRSIFCSEISSLYFLGANNEAFCAFNLYLATNEGLFITNPTLVGLLAWVQQSSFLPTELIGRLTALVRPCLYLEANALYSLNSLYFYSFHLTHYVLLIPLNSLYFYSFHLTHYTFTHST